MKLSEAAEPKEVEIEQQGIWRCAICTYDNDESTHVCEICGVIRQPVAGGGTQTINNNTCTAVSSILESYISEDFVVCFSQRS